ncbi:hypothetical protein [Pseudolactococcus paracarnosus]|uniref:hypothetical protein n=1 Tax=Pseudolactococcus paracarnosus TaxID=2749962 RepID=UPI001FB93A2C|nr:hypothetical protein [Lactococcus paracarnosus]MCJ1999233.1 hypothetical protein [Lactococcus paracarnosus]
MNEQEIEFYFCYNSTLAAKLREAKQKLITVAVSPNTGRKFWLYVRTQKLTETLDEFFINK